MSTRLFLLPGLASFVLCVGAQEPSANERIQPGDTSRSRLISQNDDRDKGSKFGVIRSSTYEPLTPREKAAEALMGSIGTRAVAGRLALAGINQATDHPHEWPNNIEGYGMRLASRMGRLWIRNSIQLSTDLAFKTDPRYDACKCSGFLKRSGHAWKRVLVALKDDGGQMISVSNIAGAYVSPMISDQWYPRRLNTWDHKLQSGSQFLVWRGGLNMLREFWPELSRKVPFGKRFYR